MIQKEMIRNVHKEMLVLPREHCEMLGIKTAILLHEFYLQNTNFYEEDINFDIKLLLTVEEIKNRTFLDEDSQINSMRTLSDRKIIRYIFSERTGLFVIEFLSGMQDYPNLSIVDRPKR